MSMHSVVGGTVDASITSRTSKEALIMVAFLLFVKRIRSGDAEASLTERNLDEFAWPN